MNKRLIAVTAVMSFCFCTMILLLIKLIIVSNPDSDVVESIDVSSNISVIVEPIVESENSVESQSVVEFDKSEPAITISSSSFNIGEEVPLPSIPTHVKFCTDYRCYNITGTPHYRLQQVAWTDENGLRRFNEDYIVGLGQFYSTDIGDRFQITLETGVEFTVILGDGKAPVDCDINNMYGPCIDYEGNSCANVLEFIMDKYAMQPEVYAYGSIDCIDEFKGNIAKMVYLGRDDSADWDTYEIY